MGQDVVNTSGQGFDGTVLSLCALNMNALTFDSILLVENSQGCFGGIEKLMQGSRVGNEASPGIPKSHISDSEGLSATFGRGVGVFSNPQEKVESDVDEVSSGLAFVAATASQCTRLLVYRLLRCVCLIIVRTRLGFLFRSVARDPRPFWV